MFDFSCFLSSITINGFNPLPNFLIAKHRIINGFNPLPFFHGDGVISAMNQIMREADQSDDITFINRVISLQDRLLRLNLSGIWDALEKAGRN